MKIKIITDSTSNLTKEQALKYDIDIIPCYVVIDGKDILDDGSIAPHEFYKMIENSTSSLTSYQVLLVFGMLLKKTKIMIV